MDSLKDGIAAVRAGATRLELCADLQYDGLTPSRELIVKLLESVSIPVRVMIRPHKHGFIYSRSQIEQMKEDISFCKKVGAEGVVFGVCNPDQTLNTDIINELARLARPMKVTIHKAIDVCKDPIKELNSLKALCPVDSVLSSGQSEKAEEALPLLKAMIDTAGKEVELIVCGKVTKENLQWIHKHLQARAYHGRRIVAIPDS